jgi:hypothetical protein
MDQIIDIADDSSRDWIASPTKDGGFEYVVDRAHIRHCRLRVKTRNWLLSRMLSKFHAD